MSTPTLDVDLASLTEEQKTDRLRLLRRYKYLLKWAWDCGDPECDGAPHPGYPVRHARAKQKPPPGDWYGWFIMSGRGFGKTRTAAQWSSSRALAEPKHRVGIVVPTFAVGRDVCVEGESGLHGLMAGDGVMPAEYIKTWNRSMGELILHNGSLFKIFGTDNEADAERLRGFQCHTLWFEEVATQRFGKLAWDMAAYALRLGTDPRAIITGTPRPTKFIRELVDDDDIEMTRGSTYDNLGNLAPAMVKRIRKKYEGTTLGQQEIHGELMEGQEGALWTREMIKHEMHRPDFARIVVAVDPAGTARSTSDLTGIMVLGVTGDGVVWVLADKSGRYSPEQWRTVILEQFHEWEADHVVAEVNFGADMVAANLRAGGEVVPFREVRASRGKAVRAAPVVTLYEKGRVVHYGALTELEDEQCTWVPPGQFDSEGTEIKASKDSPNRLDAVVWGVTELVLQPVKTRQYASFSEG